MKVRRFSIALTPGLHRGISSAKSFDFVDQLGHASRGVLFAFIFRGHETFVIGLCKKLPYTVKVHCFPVCEVVADVSMRGIRERGFDLDVSVSLRSGNEIRYVQIDSEKGRVNAVDDLKACIRVLGNARVVFHAECDTLLPGIVAGDLQGIDGPLNSLLKSGSRGQLARED